MFGASNSAHIVAYRFRFSCVSFFVLYTLVGLDGIPTASKHLDECKHQPNEVARAVGERSAVELQSSDLYEACSSLLFLHCRARVPRVLPWSHSLSFWSLPRVPLLVGILSDGNTGAYVEPRTVVRTRKRGRDKRTKLEPRIRGYRAIVGPRVLFTWG